MTDPLGQSQVIPYLIKLSKAGFHFHLLSFEKKEKYHKEKQHISDLLRAANISWHPLTYSKNPPVFSTMFDLGRMKQTGTKLISKHGIRIVHCRSYISALAGLFLQRQSGVKFIFDMRGFYADERVDGGLWNLSNPVYNAVYRFFKRKEREMLREADAVICLTEAGKIEIDSWKFRSAEKLPVAVIPCCADLELFNPANVKAGELEKLRTQLQIEATRPVISYLGSVGTWYMLDEMLDFFRLFIKENPNALFLFISHDTPDKIRSVAGSKGIPADAMRFFPARRREVPAALKLSDVSVFFIKPVFSKKASSPTKQGEIMGMGIPLLCNSGVGDTDAIVSHYGSGMVIDLRDADAMKQAVLKFDTLKNISPESIIRGAREFFSLESGSEKYLAIYRKLDS
jgi:glycosyltransferase involved in cell wall biosynthesis